LSLLDSVSDFFTNAATGNLSRHQLEVIKADTSRQIAKASAGLDPAVVKEKQAQATAEVENFVRSIDAHPDDASLRLPGLGVVGSAQFLKRLDTGVKALWVIAILAVLLFVLAKAGGLSSLKKAAKAVRGR